MFKNLLQVVFEMTRAMLVVHTSVNKVYKLSCTISFVYTVIQRPVLYTQW